MTAFAANGAELLGRLEAVFLAVVELDALVCLRTMLEAQKRSPVPWLPALGAAALVDPFPALLEESVPEALRFGHDIHCNAQLCDCK